MPAQSKDIFHIFAAQIGSVRNFRAYAASVLLVLFCCYYSGISMFSHVHIKNGTSVVHSHLGGGAGHSHSDSQYAVIDILSHFQSENVESFDSVGIPFFQLTELFSGYSEPECLRGSYPVYSLRGPPQA